MRKLSLFAAQKQLLGIEILVFTIISIIIFCNNLLSVEFQPDETFWIVSSIRFDHFIMGDFNTPIWNDSIPSYEFRPVPSYIVGFSQRLGGISPDVLPLNYWDWSVSKETNISNGAMPDDLILYFSRLPMAVIAGITIVVTTILISTAHSRIAAYVFFLISFNEYFLLHLRRAMSESPLMLFTILAIASTTFLLTEIKKRNFMRIVCLSIAVGIFSGLAGQSKLTGLACGITAIIASFLTLYRQRFTYGKTGTRIFQITSMVILFTTATTFIVAYPFLYQTTVLRTARTFYVRSIILNSQLQSYPSQVISPRNRPIVLLNRVFDYPLRQTKVKELNILLPGINLIITAYGIFFAIKHVLYDSNDSDISLALLIASLTLGIPMLFTPLDWDRYYLYPVFFSLIFFSIGISQLFFSMNKVKLFTSVGMQPTINQ